MIICVFIVLASICGIFLYRKTEPGKPSSGQPVATSAASLDPEAESPDQQYSLVPLGAACYDYDDLNFRFAILEARFSSDLPYEVTLGHFKTDEGIALDETDAYVRTLEEHSYYLSRRDVVYHLSGEGEQTVSLFVPYTGEKESVVLFCDLAGVDEIEIDVSKPLTDKSLLRYANDASENSMEITASTAFEITGSYLYENNGGNEEEYLLPSTARVFVFRLRIVTAEEELRITEARFITDANETLEAFPAGVRSEKHENILGKTVREGDSGCVFFCVYDPEGMRLSYSGMLELKLEGYDEWIRIAADLDGKEMS